MITFRKERYDEAIGEFAPMLASYWNASPQNHDHVPLDMDWELYRYLDNSGVLHITVGREDGKMIAAALYNIMVHPHHKTMKIAHADIFAVDLSYRNKGIGAALFRAAEPLLAAAGATKVVNCYRECYGVTPIFEKLGFKWIERVYTKEIA